MCKNCAGSSTDRAPGYGPGGWRFESSLARTFFMSMLLKVFVTGPLQNNVILFGCEKTKEAALVDPALSSFRKVREFLEESEYQLKKILLTHSHWDHIGECAKFKKEFHVEISVHEDDAYNLEHPGSDGLLLAYIQGVKPDKLLKDQDKLFIGEIEVQVMHTPGHTPGCVCYYLPREGILFSGDTLFKGSMGRVDFPHSQPDKMWDSLKKLSQLPPDTRVIPGHGDETSVQAEGWIGDEKA